MTSLFMAVSAARHGADHFDLVVVVQGAVGVARAGHELLVDGGGKRRDGRDQGDCVGERGAGGQLAGVVVDQDVHWISRAKRGASEEAPVASHSIAVSSIAGAMRKPWRYRPLTCITRGCSQRMAGRLSGSVGRHWVAISRMRASAKPLCTE